MESAVDSGPDLRALARAYDLIVLLGDSRHPALSEPARCSLMTAGWELEDGGAHPVSLLVEVTPFSRLLEHDTRTGSATSAGDGLAELVDCMQLVMSSSTDLADTLRYERVLDHLLAAADHEGVPSL